jgi:sulfite reductase (ferredoxin)
MATRLAQLYSHNIPLDEIPATLRPLLAAWAAERAPGESFGDYCYRVGVETLKKRFREAAQ